MIEAVAKQPPADPDPYAFRHNKTAEVQAEQKQPHRRQPEMIPERDEDLLAEQPCDDEHQYAGQHKPPRTARLRRYFPIANAKQPACRPAEDRDGIEQIIRRFHRGVNGNWE